MFLLLTFELGVMLKGDENASHATAYLRLRFL